MGININCPRHSGVGVMAAIARDMGALTTRGVRQDRPAPLALIIAAALCATTAAPTAVALPQSGAIYLPPPTDGADCPAEWRSYWIAHQSTMRYVEIQSFLANTPAGCGALRAEVAGRLAQSDYQLHHTRLSKQDVQSAPSPPAIAGQHGPLIPPTLVH